MNKRISTAMFFPFLFLLFFNLSYTNVSPQEKLQTHRLVKPYTVEKIVRQNKSNKPKNIILMIGDGMSLSIMYSAWTTNRGQLYIDNFEYVGLVKTYGADHLITDSGAAGTAIAIGKKTNVGYLGIDSEGTPHKSVLEIAKENKRSTGLIATCNILDATPSAFIAKTTDRSNWDKIALQYVDSDVDFVCGGGWENFRYGLDGRDLTNELAGKGYAIPRTIGELEKVNEGKVFALIADDYLPLPRKRGDALSKATMKAIELLTQNESGFFLMVESSIIDGQAHENNLELVMEETLDFDQTIGAVLKWAAEDGETLVIVTADHETGGLTLVDGDIASGKIVAKFSTGHHSGVMVPLYSFGPTAENYSGVFENSELFDKMNQSYGFNN